MLTTDLVRVSYQKDSIVPRYVDPAKKSLVEMAENLISLYQEHQGRRRGELKECLDDLLRQSPQQIIYRGLCKLLEDRCEFEAEEHIDPVEMRQLAFQLAAEEHRLGTFDRSKILNKIATQFSLSISDVERLLFADLKDNQIIHQCKPISPGKLLQLYNTSLAQAVLLRASLLEIRILEEDPRRYRQLFRAIKFHRLLYQISHHAQGGFLIQLDGPMNLFRSSQKYGLQMALFLPALLLCTNWSLTAQVQWGRRRQEKKFNLSNQQGLYSNYRDTGMYQPPEWQVFSDRFRQLQSPWEIAENTDFVELSAQEICIPDYSFAHTENGAMIYLEIFGFWRKYALDKRLALMAATQHENKKQLLLAISKKLSVDSELQQRQADNIYHFHEVLNPKQVRKRLDAMMGNS